MNPSSCSRKVVHDIFHSLLSNTVQSNARQSLPPPAHLLTKPPAKNDIRFIENDQNNRREKYDGHRWRLVCTWNVYKCTNIAQGYQICSKHLAQRRSKEPPKKKRKPLINHLSLPLINQFNHNGGDDEDDLEIIEEYCKNPTTRHSTNSTIKTEASGFSIFSVEHVPDNHRQNTIKSEPRASSSYTSNMNNDIEYISSKCRNTGLNIDEFLSKNLPPLTEFEEEYLGKRLMEKLPRTGSMIDAQVFIRQEATEVVRKNYRIKMDTIAPDYFYDFLLRQPSVLMHYKNWFLRCKPLPPATGCPIDNKVWSLGMIVRGATTSDNMIDECD